MKTQYILLAGLVLIVGSVLLTCIMALGARAGERNIMEREPQDMPVCPSCQRRHIPGLACEVAS